MLISVITLDIILTPLSLYFLSVHITFLKACLVRVWFEVYLLYFLTEYIRDVYTLCIAVPTPLGQRLYKELKLFFEQHVLALSQVPVDTLFKHTLSRLHFDLTLTM